jgi:HSP20 family protein
VSSMMPFRPFAELMDMERELGRIFRGMVDVPAGPSVDVRDAGDRVEVIADLPGIKPEDVEVTVDQGILTIEARREEEREEPAREGEGYLWRERKAAVLRRQLRLPETVRPEDVRARLANGVLTISIPKTEGPRPVQVPVAEEGAEEAQVRTGQRGEGRGEGRAEGRGEHKGEGRGERRGDGKGEGKKR